MDWWKDYWLIRIIKRLDIKGSSFSVAHLQKEEASVCRLLFLLFFCCEYSRNEHSIFHSIRSIQIKKRERGELDKMNRVNEKFSEKKIE